MNISPKLTIICKNPIYFLATGFGSGLLPKMPGTWGTIAALPIYLLLIQLPLFVYILILFVMFLVGIWLCGVTAKMWGLRDPSAIVWDEIVGYLFTMLIFPRGWQWMIIGFILFRLFDIWKPWPIQWLDKKIRGGFGIMVDDVVAALFSGLTLLVFNIIFHLL